VAGKATLGDGKSLVIIDSPNIIVESVKAPERGGGFVLRLYEAGKTGTHANLVFGVPVVSVHETNMLEEDARPLHVVDGGIELYFRRSRSRRLCVGCSSD